MTDIKTSTSGDTDFAIELGDIVIVSGLDVTAQRVIDVSHTDEGEWFVDTRYGIPYFRELIKKGITQSLIDNVFRSEINSVLSGDEIIEKLESSLDQSRLYSAAVEISRGADTVTQTIGVQA